MGEISGAFVGSVALRRGLLTEYQLRRWYRPIFRDVYLPRGVRPSLRDRTIGASLRTRGYGVIAGAAASALHGARWVDADVRIEVIGKHLRKQSGLIVRNESLRDDEITEVAGLRVTTVARTAYDLGRHLPRHKAVARLDALARVGRFRAAEVLAVADRHPGARGLARLRVALPLVDPGAESPRESELRVTLIDAGFPVPTTQIPLYSGGRVVARLDMGWEEHQLAAEYDGEHHSTDRRTYVHGIRRDEFILSQGWQRLPVVKEDSRARIIDRVDKALRARGWRP